MFNKDLGGERSGEMLERTDLDEKTSAGEMTEGMSKEKQIEELNNRLDAMEEKESAGLPLTVQDISAKQMYKEKLEELGAPRE